MKENQVTFMKKLRVRISILMLIPCMPIILPAISIARLEDGFFKCMYLVLKDLIDDFINPQ